MLEMSLLAQEQFFAEVAALPMYSEEDRYRLMRLTCQGDKQARQELVLSLVPLLLPTAWSCASWCHHLSVLDIIQAGCETLLLTVDRALWIENPLGYLVRAAQCEMMRACSSRNGLVKIPKRVMTPYQFVSLDKPFEDPEGPTLAEMLPAPDSSSSDDDYSALYEALAQLPEDRRLLLARHYGLMGYSPTPLAELAAEMYPHLSKKRAYNKVRGQVQAAQLALQALMVPSYRPEMQETPEEFYTAIEIREQFGVNGDQLRFWVSKGRVTRYPAPDGVRSQFVPFVYNKDEIDKAVKEWQPRKSISCRALAGGQSVAPGPLTRSTLDARRCMLAVGEKEEVA